jgi:hypothetical protein
VKLKIFLLFFLLNAFWAESGLAKVKDKRIPMLNYDKEFGDASTKPETIFNFKDVQLKFLGVRELTEDEKNEKSKSVAAGIDGGASMLSPSNKFQIISRKSGEKLEIELSMVPFAKNQFDLDTLKFELKNSRIKNKKWVLVKIANQ